MLDDVIYQLEEQEMLLLVGAILFFGVGDMLTTIVGLQFLPRRRVRAACGVCPV